MVNELNLCNITWERRGFVPVYSYQCARQEDTLDDIVPKNSEQFLGLKIFSACISSVGKRGVGGLAQSCQSIFLSFW